MAKQTVVRRDVRYELCGVAMIALGLILMVSALGIDAGVLSRALTSGLRYLIGEGIFMVPLALVFFGVSLLVGRGVMATGRFAGGFGLLYTVFLGGTQMRVDPSFAFDPQVRDTHGGVVGYAIAFVLRKAVGTTGATIVLVTLAVLGVLVISEVAPSEVARWIGVRGALVLDWFTKRADRSRKRVRRTKSQRAPSPAVPSHDMISDPDSAESEASAVEVVTAPATPVAVVTPAAAASEPPSFKVVTAEPPSRRAGVGTLKLFDNAPPLPEYFLDTINALEAATRVDSKQGDADVEHNVKLVEETLASFNISAKVTQVKRGPVVTRYEIQPAPGIRVNRITNLADDLALALAAIDVRVEAPVPGKSVIGIEVPNKRNHLVRLREIIEMEEFICAPSKLTFALGKDIAGKPMIADMTKMPHLLIGGATNSGKSVCLNAIITSILCRATPEEVKLSLIDPKRVELTLFKDVPHLFHPVVVDAKDAVRALRGSIQEMDRRYKLFAERGVRNIATFNKRLKPGEQPLYYIVIIIDELADLMMQAAQEFERLICRIAQLARATGIHLVVATQRPSVNVITGVIKANISSRIAFAVASQVDSRTILDMNGAERLIGQGDMLYHPIDAAKPIRIQGAYLDETEVNRVCQALGCEVDEDIEFGLDLASIEDVDLDGSKPKNGSEERDDLFDQAVDIIRRRQQASASMLQREFEIGYPRAGRLIDQLQKAGIVGPQEGSKPRQVLINPIADAPGFAPADEEVA